MVPPFPGTSIIKPQRRRSTTANPIMLASQPSSFSSIACWPNLQDTITHRHNNYHIYAQTNEASESLVDHCPPFQLDHFTPSTSISSNPTTVQKLCHNARERTRRRRINVLFSTLRSVLPAADDPMKKLSIPATVSGVVKYIPELQEQVEGLIQKKEELLSRISRQEQQTRHENPRQQLQAQRSSSAVAASWLNDREVMIQISTYKSPLSEILLNLEEDGFQLLNASSFESFGGRVFHNLHLQLERIDKLEHAYDQVLSDKLLLYEKGGAI